MTSSADSSPNSPNSAGVRRAAEGASGRTKAERLKHSEAPRPRRTWPLTVVAAMAGAAPGAGAGPGAAPGKPKLKL